MEKHPPQYRRISLSPQFLKRVYNIQRSKLLLIVNIFYMENLDKKQCGDNGCKSSCQGGTCGEMHSMSGCGGCHGGKHHLKKMILKLIIVILIFWCGFKLGEITGSIR